MKNFPVPDVIRQFSRYFIDNGFSLYIVGGAVRDFLLGCDNHDFDFCTNATPQNVMEIFHNVLPTGIKHGTVTVLFKGNSYEVTTFRTEGKYTDKRHPDNVSFVTDLDEDLSRRDFTINAFAADCYTGKIIDLFNGKEDLNNKIIKAIGNPAMRFSEDALRMMRMCRFCAKLSFNADEETKKQATLLAKNIQYVSQERICDELFKTLMSKNPVTGLNLMDETGLLNYILPEVEFCKNIQQDKAVSQNLLEHLFLTVKAASDNSYDLPVRVAALLHDIGKAECIRENKDYTVFYGHDTVGAKMAEKVLRRLKCSNELTNKVCILIANHMIRYNQSWTDGAVKRFINRVGKDNINNLFELQWCDQIATDGKANVQLFDSFIERIKLCCTKPLSVTDLCINGNDMASVGIKKGPEMGIILKKLLEAVLDDESKNNKEDLIKMAIDLYHSIPRA